MLSSLLNMAGLSMGQLCLAYGIAIVCAAYVWIASRKYR